MRRQTFITPEKVRMQGFANVCGREVLPEETASAKSQGKNRPSMFSNYKNG